jgi:hypothetical protein
MQSCRVTDGLDENCLAAGMSVQEIDQEEREDMPADFISETRAAPTRKTRAQRKKEARLSAEASICKILIQHKF